MPAVAASGPWNSRASQQRLQHFADALWRHHEALLDAQLTSFWRAEVWKFCVSLVLVLQVFMFHFLCVIGFELYEQGFDLV